MKQQPKILLLDIETAPMLGYVWSLWGNNIALNQLESDWHILSWCAKWLGDPKSKIMYEDQMDVKDLSDDSKILKSMWKLLCEADIVITHNGIKFDQKRLNARFIINHLPPPSSYKHIDTLRIAKKNFGFSSNKLEYLAKVLGVTKKSAHSKFPGFQLWTECLKNNPQAWAEMRRYNIQDVIVLEEVYNRMAAWDNSLDVNVYHDDEDVICKCGNKEYKKSGFYYTDTGKFQKYKCTQCSHETRSKENLLTLKKRKNLRVKIAK